VSYRSPTLCAYAPPGEYVKDHSLLFHDGRWHLFSISGTRGYSHLSNGNEETVSWSVSRDLVDWELRGHVLHASLRRGEFDQHEVWSPFCLHADGRFRLFYTGVVHPHRPLVYERLGHRAPQDWTGHKETIGLAVSDDLASWEKVADRENGLGVPGRDPHVVHDPEHSRWLLYSTGRHADGTSTAFVSTSRDLATWDVVGVCTRFPDPPGRDWVATESLTVMRHPLSGRWIMLGNFQFAVSDDPLDFTQSEVRSYFEDVPDGAAELARLGFAGEMVESDGRWYRSGVLGTADAWMLGFHEIEWVRDGAFRVREPSVVRWLL
jgi:predicted GH43/DUF377 family glycosyl hydrolase